MNRLLLAAGLVVMILALGGCTPINWPPVSPPVSPPAPPAECLPGVPWCSDVGQTCSRPDAPCKHNPTSDPAACEQAAPCPPMPSPPPAACMSEEDLVDYHTCPADFLRVVKKATDALGDVTGLDPGDNLRKLAEVIRAQNPGLCVIAGIEAVFMLRADGSAEENHAVYFGDGGWTGSGFGKHIGCHVRQGAPPPVEPEPEPEPESGPEPEPGPDTCTAELGPFAAWSSQCPKGHGNWWDCTSLFGDGDRCARIGYTARLTCPSTMEGDPQRPACDKAALGGDPQIRCSVGGVKHKVELQGWENPYVWRCTDPRAEWTEICLPNGTRCKRRSF